MTHLQMKIDSKIGPLYLMGTEHNLCGVHWEMQDIPFVQDNASPEKKLLEKAAAQLDEYFAGKRKIFDLPLYAEGTDFQKKVWQALSNIPYGETRSYKDIAAELQNPKAYRAVGTANGQNPLCIIVPCHRVIAADGMLGGFAGGLAIKESLLRLEKPGTL